MYCIRSFEWLADIIYKNMGSVTIFKKKPQSVCEFLLWQRENSPSEDFSFLHQRWRLRQFQEPLDYRLFTIKSYKATVFFWVQCHHALCNTLSFSANFDFNNFFWYKNKVFFDNKKTCLNLILLRIPYCHTNQTVVYKCLTVI
jgi:hypothetical protein